MGDQRLPRKSARVVPGFEVPAAGDDHRDDRRCREGDAKPRSTTIQPRLYYLLMIVAHLPHADALQRVGVALVDGTRVHLSERPPGGG